MKKSSTILSSLLIGTSLFTLVSCGNDDGGSQPAENSFQQEQHLVDEGVYRAVLKPLNPAFAGDSAGTAEIRIEGDDVMIKSHMTGVPSGIKHYQNITASTACPEMSADANADGVVDFSEMLPFTGPVLIPLDSNLSGQLEGIDYGPIANSRGTYVYKRSSSLSRILADLQALDPDPLDKMVKIPGAHLLNLSGKVIVVHGVSAGTALPQTAVGYGDQPAASYLPIACGQIVRIETEGPSDEDTSIGDDVIVEEAGTEDVTGVTTITSSGTVL